MEITLVLGHITEQRADAVVNAAHSPQGGPEILEEVRREVPVSSTRSSVHLHRTSQSSWAMSMSCRHSSTTNTAEPAKANQKGAATPRWVARTPPINEPTTRPA